MSKSERGRRRQQGCKPSAMPKNSRKRKSNLKKMNVVGRLKSKQIRSRCSLPRPKIRLSRQDLQIISARLKNLRNVWNANEKKLTVSKNCNKMSSIAKSRMLRTKLKDCAWLARRNFKSTKTSWLLKRKKSKRCQHAKRKPLWRKKKSGGRNLKRKWRRNLLD